MSERDGDPWGTGPTAERAGTSDTEAEAEAGSEASAAGDDAAPEAAAPSGTPSWTVSPPRPHTAAQSRRWSVVVAATLVLAYWFAQWPLPRLLRDHPDYNFYLVQPALWLLVGGLAFLGWRRLAERPRFSRLLLGIGFLAGIFHLAILVIAGVLWSFGNSPVGGKLVNYPKNLLFFTTLLAGLEMARTYLFEVWRRVNRRAAFVGVSALLFVVGVAAAQWGSFPSVDRGLTVVGGRWVPALALSFLCTWLVSYGGVGPSFAYRWVLVAFEWFSPILPNLDWPIQLALGLAVPVAAEWLVRGMYQETREGALRYPRQEEAEKARAPERPAWRRWAGWGVTAAILTVMVLFFVGVFGVHLSVVEGRSMEPTYSRGDMLFVQEGVDPQSLRVADVIQFHLGSLPVVHRIISIEDTGAGRVFTTQGDGMDEPDPPITAAEIDGKVVFGIPGVGYLNLWLRGR